MGRRVIVLGDPPGEVDNGGRGICAVRAQKMQAGTPVWSRSASRRERIPGSEKEMEENHVGPNRPDAGSRYGRRVCRADADASGRTRAVGPVRRRQRRNTVSLGQKRRLEGQMLNVTDRARAKLKELLETESDDRSVSLRLGKM